MPTNPEDYKYNSYTIKNDRGDYLVRCMICGEKSNGELIPDDVQANVTLSAGFDIYVEVWLVDDTMIVVYAHEHRPGDPRLPQ